jgi:hypothetical protein
MFQLNLSKPLRHQFESRIISEWIDGRPMRFEQVECFCNPVGEDPVYMAFSGEVRKRYKQVCFDIDEQRPATAKEFSAFELERDALSSIDITYLHLNAPEDCTAFPIESNIGAEVTSRKPLGPGERFNLHNAFIIIKLGQKLRYITYFKTEVSNLTDDSYRCQEGFIDCSLTVPRYCPLTTEEGTPGGYEQFRQILMTLPRISIGQVWEHLVQPYFN